MEKNNQVECLTCHVFKDRETEFYKTRKLNGHLLQGCKQCRVTAEQKRRDLKNPNPRKYVKKADKPKKAPEIIVINKIAPPPTAETIPAPKRKRGRVAVNFGCSVPKCKNEHAAKGFCQAHYNADRKKAKEAIVITPITKHLIFTPAYSPTISRFRPTFYKTQQLYSLNPVKYAKSEIQQTKFNQILTQLRPDILPMLVLFDSIISLEYQFDQDDVYSVIIYEGGKIQFFHNNIEFNQLSFLNNLSKQVNQFLQIP